MHSIDNPSRTGFALGWAHHHYPACFTQQAQPSLDSALGSVSCMAAVTGCCAPATGCRDGSLRCCTGRLTTRSTLPDLAPSPLPLAKHSPSWPPSPSYHRPAGSSRSASCSPSQHPRVLRLERHVGKLHGVPRRLLLRYSGRRRTHRVVRTRARERLCWFGVGLNGRASRAVDELLPFQSAEPLVGCGLRRRECACCREAPFLLQHRESLASFSASLSPTVL